MIPHAHQGGADNAYLISRLRLLQPDEQWAAVTGCDTLLPQAADVTSRFPSNV
jgi:hypothetical protein